jgi:AbrB family looped-hinge helix DNA binding protein
VARSQHVWHNQTVARSEAVAVTVGPKGRLVVPAALRRRLGISQGDVLVARAENDRLVLESRDAILARLQRRFAAVPADVSLVDELLEERREESRRESRG